MLIRPRDPVPSHSRWRADRCWPSAGLRGGQLKRHRMFSRPNVVACHYGRTEDWSSLSRLRGLALETNLVLADLCGGERSRWDASAAKDPEDDEAFRADNAQMGAEGLIGLRTRQWKRRLRQTTDVNRACCRYFCSARAGLAGACMVHFGVDAAVVGGLTGCWCTLLFHLDLVAGQPRRTSLAPFVSPAHKLSCRSNRVRKFYIHLFFFSQTCRHINFCFHVCSRLFLLAAPQRPS